MKRMKRSVKQTLMVVGCSLVASFAAFGTTTWKDSKGITWKFERGGTNPNDTAKITGATPVPKGALTIPATVYDDEWPCTVTEIGNDVFYGNSGITSVVIPAGVTDIGNGAFESCANLKSVTFKGALPCTLSDAFWGTPFYEEAYNRKDNVDDNSPKVIAGESGAAKDDNFFGWGTTLTGAKAVKWYEWTAPKSGTVWFWTQGNNFNTFLGAYAYGTTDDIAHNDNFAGGASYIVFPVTMGTKYTLYVGGADPNFCGEYTLKWRMGSPVTVTFDPCGGVMDSDIGFGGNIVPYPKNAAATTLPTPTKEYYTLAGWYTKKSGGTKVTASTKFTKTTKLYAHWAKKKLRVIVTKGEGAKSVKGPGSYAWGTKVKLSATPKPGYVFWTWNSDTSPTYWPYYDASCKAFPKFNTQRRKNMTPTVTVPKDSPICYIANFVKKSEDKMAIQITDGSTTLYAEDGAGGSVKLEADSFSYPKVTTSKLPAGVKFSLVPPPASPGLGVRYDSEYKLEIVNPDKVPAGKNIIKITAKNRSGKKATKSIVVWGKNKTQAADKGVLTVFGGVLVKDPNEIYTGVKYKPSDWGAQPTAGWKITKIGGLPAGITWDAKNQKLKGYTKKTGLYTFTFTVAKGKTQYVNTATFKVLPLPAKAVGAFNGYTTFVESGDSFIPSSRKLSLSVTKDGKVSAKVGNVSFASDGLLYEPDGMKFKISMKSSSTKSNVTYSRTLSISLSPFAEYDENSVTGSYTEKTTKKVGKNSSVVKVDTYNVVGRKNVFGYDDHSNLLFEGAGLAQDALNQAVSNHQSSDITFAEGSVTVALDERYNGLATLTGTIDGQPFSESAVVWYESDPKDNTRAYLVINSFNLGKSIIYVLTLDLSGPFTDTVSEPGFPEG